MNKRRIWIAVSIVLLLVVVGGGVLLASLPSMVSERVRRTSAERFGLQAEFAEPSIRWDGIVIRQLRFSMPQDGGVEIEVGALRVSGNLMSLALSGTAALRAFALEDVGVTVDASKDGLARMASKFRSPRSGAGSGARASRRDLTVERFTVEMVDGQGALISVQGESVRGGPEGLDVVLSRLVVGGADVGTLKLTDPKATIRRDHEGLKLQRASAAGASLQLPPAPPAPDEPAPSAPGDPVPEDVDGADLDTVGSSDDGPGAAAVERPDGLVTRLLSLVDQVRPGDSGPGATAATAEGRARLSWIAPDAELSLLNGAVVDGSGERVLRKLEGTLVAESSEVLKLVGRGSAAGGGTVSWDMRVWPGQLRADGNVTLESLPLTLVAPLLPRVPWHEPENSRIDANLVVQSESVQKIAVSGSATLRDGAIASPRVAPSPVEGVTLSVLGKGHWLPLQRRLEVESGSLSIGEATANVSGALEFSQDHYLIDLDAQLPSTPCTDAIHAVPAQLLDEMSHAKWAGTIEGTLDLFIDSRDLPGTVLDFNIKDHCQFVTVPVLADLRRFRGPFVQSVIEPDGSLFEMETGPGTQTWTDISNVSPYFIHAVLSHEDARFFSHRGFSPSSIRDALVRNLEAGRYVVGASTITMQLVKNVFLRREKTLSRKVQEVLLTWWIERVMDKRDILELYLNVIEYGPRVYGIRNAAKHYFNRLPAQLSPAESIYLSTILPSPKRYHSHFEQGSISAVWRDRMRKIFSRMRARGWYSPQAADYGLAELANFGFSRGGVTEARLIPGHAAPLPYMVEEQPSEWDEELEQGLPTDGSDVEPPTDGPDVEPSTDGSDVEHPTHGPDLEPPIDADER